MDIRTVREIIQCGPTTTVPLMPACVRGVINLRGAVVPVIDLHARFGGPPAQPGPKTCIVIVDAMRGGERLELGLLVDAVSEVIEIPAERIEPPPQFGAGVRRDFILGMGRADERFVILLDPDEAFDVDDMARRPSRRRRADPRGGRPRAGPRADRRTGIAGRATRGRRPAPGGRARRSAGGGLG